MTNTALEVALQRLTIQLNQKELEDHASHVQNVALLLSTKNTAAIVASTRTRKAAEWIGGWRVTAVLLQQRQVIYLTQCGIGFLIEQTTNVKSADGIKFTLSLKDLLLR